MSTSAFNTAAGFLGGFETEVNCLETARRARLAQGLPVLDLTSSNPTLHGCIFPSRILKDLSGAYWEGRRYDPDARGSGKAREAIAGYYRLSRNCDFRPDDIFITAGTSESYAILFSLLADPGDNIIVPEVTYPLFELLAEARKLELRSYRIFERSSWCVDYESLIHQKDDRTRAVLIISPHNPTGMIIRERNEGLALLGIPVISDEVFAEFADSDPAPCLSSLYPDIPVFQLNGISKMFALPDMKLGWIAMNEVAGRLFAGRLEILNDCFLSAGSLIQFMLSGVFSAGMPFCREMTRSVRERVRYVHRYLQDAGLHCVFPEGGTFVFPSLPEHVDEEKFAVELLQEGVLVHPGYFYGEVRKPHMMISCVPQIEELSPGLEKIVLRLSGCQNSPSTER